MVMLSEAPLLITEKTVRQSISPADDALKIPASVSAPVPVPAPKVQIYSTALSVTVVEVRDVRDEPTAEPRVVSPEAAAVLSVPTSMCDMAVTVASFIREAI